MSLYPSLVVLVGLSASVAGACEQALGVMTGTVLIEPGEAARRLDARPGPLLLDVRDSQSFAMGHVPGAVNLRPSEVGAFLRRRPPLPGQEVGAICYQGYLSQATAAAALGQGVARAWSLEGGMARWQALGLPMETGSGQKVLNDWLQKHYIELKTLELVFAYSIGFFVKPLCLFLAGIGVFWLRRANGPGQNLIRRGLLLLLVSEAVSAIAILVGRPPDHTLLILRGLGAVMFLSLGLWGMLLGVRARASNALASAGEGLWPDVERAPLGMPLGRGSGILLLVLVGCTALLALLPWTLPLRLLEGQAMVLGVAMPLSVELPQMLLELRVYPGLAALLLLGFGVCLAVGIRAPGLLAWGLGLLVVSLQRFLLLETFRSSPIFIDLWAQVLELAWLLATLAALQGLAGRGILVVRTSAHEEASP